MFATICMEKVTPTYKQILVLVLSSGKDVSVCEYASSRYIFDIGH